MRAPRLPFLLTALATAAFLAAVIAGASLKDAREVDPAAARKAFTDAQTARTRFDWDGAIELYTRSIWLDPGNAEAYYGRGLTRATTGDPAGATRDLRVALLLRDHYDEALLARAGTRLQLGDLDGAFDDVRAALRHDPSNPAYHLQLASLLSLTGDRAATSAEYLAAATLYEAKGVSSLAETVRRLAGDAPEPSAPALRPLPQIADVVTAERLLFNQYVDPPSYQSLISGAWQGARSLALARGAAVPVSLGPVFGTNQSSAEEGLRQALQALATLSAGKATTADLVFEAIDAMARTLDDNHTVFARPSAVVRQAGGSYGLGVYGVRDTSGAILVREVAPGSPAATAGLKPGDILRNRDSNLNLEDTQNEAVRVGVDRPGRPEFEVVLAPGPFSLPLISARLLDSDIGYVRIQGFPAPLEKMGDGRSFLQFLDGELQDLKSRGATRWILDLRGNSGGLSTTAAAVAGRFGARGVVSEARFRQQQVRLDSAFGPVIVKNQPLAVLVDRQSLSMAEVLSGALQDSGRAKVFGATTGGKVNGAIIQGIAGGALEVTIARIRTGPGRLELDETGLTPTALVALDRGDLAGGKDTQLDAAVRYLLSRSSR